MYDKIVEICKGRGIETIPYAIKVQTIADIFPKANGDTRDELGAVLSYFKGVLHLAQADALPSGVSATKAIEHGYTMLYSFATGTNKEAQTQAGDLLLTVAASNVRGDLETGRDQDAVAGVKQAAYESAKCLADKGELKALYVADTRKDLYRQKNSRKAQESLKAGLLMKQTLITQLSENEPDPASAARSIEAYLNQVDDKIFAMAFKQHMEWRADKVSLIAVGGTLQHPFDHIVKGTQPEIKYIEIVDVL